MEWAHLLMTDLRLYYGIKWALPCLHCSKVFLSGYPLVSHLLLNSCWPRFS